MIVLITCTWNHLRSSVLWQWTLFQWSNVLYLYT